MEQLRLEVSRQTSEANAEVEERASREAEQLNRLHEHQMTTQTTLHQTELNRLETMYQNQLTLIQGQLQNVQERARYLEQENTRLRDEMNKLQVDQLKELQKERDPIEALGRYAELTESVKAMGIGGGDAGDGLSEDAPDWMKMLNSLSTAWGPAVSQFMGARQQNQEQAAQMQQMQMMQQQQLQAAQAQQQTEGAQASVPTTLVKSDPEAKKEFDKAELQEILNHVETLRNGGTEPADAAAAIRKHVDRAVLGELAKWPPDIVLGQLEAAGLLMASLLTEEGKTYLTELLMALRQLEDEATQR
jgi:hypothetical protein